MDKGYYRSFMRKHRRDFVLSNPLLAKSANSQIVNHALGHIDSISASLSSRNIAGYWPMGHEVDDIPLLEALLSKDYTLSLPKTNGGEPFLDFCEWTQGMEMEEGDLGFSYPVSGTSHHIPGLVIVPLVAFDHRGYRLGYGKGYYDKTLEVLYSKDPSIVTVGLAFSIQRVDELPAEPHDMKLDYVVTEEGTLKFPN